MLKLNLPPQVTINNYGFVWGECLVERTCSNPTKPKFQILRVYTPNGEVIEILMRPRKNKITITSKEERDV
jgi:hypothetical protein